MNRQETLEATECKVRQCKVTLSNFQVQSLMFCIDKDRKKKKRERERAEQKGGPFKLVCAKTNRQMWHELRVWEVKS